MKKTGMLLALGAALILGSCGGGAPQPPAETPKPAETQAPSAPSKTPDPEEFAARAAERYSIRLDPRVTWVVDGNGNEIPPEKNFTVLRDMLTQQPVCQVLERKEKYPDGWVGVRTLSALYDMQGNLLHDWEEISYREAFGDFLIRCNDPERYGKDFYDLDSGYRCELWNFRTGEERMEGVDTVTRLDDETALLYSAQGTLLGAMDRGGGDWNPAPAPYEGGFAWNGYIVGRVRSEGINEDVFMTRDFQPLFSKEFLFDGDGDGFLAYRVRDTGPEETGFISAPEGKILFRLEGEEISAGWFDGERAIVYKGSYFLWDKTGTSLCGPYEALIPMGPGEAGAFMGVRDGRVERIDREGKVLSSLELPGAMDVYREGDGLYRVSLDGAEALLDDTLRVIVEPGKYYWFLSVDELQQARRTPTGLIQAAYYLGNTDIIRFDLLDASGQIVIHGLTNISDAGPDRLMVQRGFEAGLMDFEGNFIVKKSIFASFNEDYSEWSAY